MRPVPGAIRFRPPGRLTGLLFVVPPALQIGQPVRFLAGSLDPLPFATARDVAPLPLRNRDEDDLVDHIARMIGDRAIRILEARREKLIA